MRKTLKKHNTTRRHDLDNLRTFLTCLVIVHHTSNCYGGPGNGPYKSDLIAGVNPASRLPLFVFNAINQSFFMGLFFWISGRLSAESLAKIAINPERSRWPFIRSKMLRLGLPAVLYTLMLEPATFLAVLPSWDVASIKEFLSGYFATLDRIKGPVWYTANLLLFDLAAVCFEGAVTLFSKKDRDLRQPLWYATVRKYGWIATALASFVVRIYYPVGTTIKPSALQVAFAPQYIFAYTMGFASLNVEPIFTGPFSVTLPRAIDEPKDAKGRKPIADQSRTTSSLVKAMMISLLLVPSPQIPRLFSTEEVNLGALGASGIYGGWNSTSLLYSIWNELSFVLIGPALAFYFLNFYKKPAMSRLFQSRDSYGAYLAHMLISTVVERGFDGVLVSDNSTLRYFLGSSVWKACGPVVLTLVVGAMNVVVTFAVARFMLNKLPVLRRIL